MSTRKSWTLWPAACLVALAVTLVAELVAAGVCVNCPPQEGCCTNDCLCYPNATHWGFFPNVWRTRWPQEKRPDIDDPAGMGREVIPKPKGQPPAQLPKEQYAEPETPGTTGMPIQEGVTTGPAPSGPTGSPFQFEPGPAPATEPSLEPPPAEPSPEPGLPSLPGLPVMPEGPLPPSSRAVPGSPAGSAFVFGPGDPAPQTLLAEGAADRSGVISTAGAGDSLPRWRDGLPSSGPLAPLPPTSAVPQTPRDSSPMPGAWVQGQRDGRPGVSPTNGVRPAVGSEPAESGEAGPGWRTRRAAAATPAERPVSYEAPLPRAPLGLDGYCPVALVRSEQWVEGNPQLAVEYEGRTYYLSGPAEHRAFRAEPQRFAPALAGCDVVLTADGVGRVSGRTDACVVYEGRLYMFADSASLERFRADPKRYAAAARESER